MTLSLETLASVSGIVLSLLFSYLPGLQQKYDSLSGDYKRLIMAGMLLLTTAGLVVYDCRSDSACYAASLEPAIRVFVAALVANQGAYLLTPENLRNLGAR